MIFIIFGKTRVWAQNAIFVNSYNSVVRIEFTALKGSFTMHVGWFNESKIKL